MKRQRVVVSVSSFEAAEMAAAKKKKPNKAQVTDNDQKALRTKINGEDEKKKKNMEVVAVGDEEINVRGLANNWDDINYWPYWIGDFVDEQMSWGSVWFPFWGLDFSGDAFGALYGDVVWDDDLWNLKQQIPNPFHQA